MVTVPGRSFTTIGMISDNSVRLPLDAPIIRGFRPFVVVAGSPVAFSEGRLVMTTGFEFGHVCEGRQ